MVILTFAFLSVLVRGGMCLHGGLFLCRFTGHDQGRACASDGVFASDLEVLSQNIVYFAVICGCLSARVSVHSGGVSKRVWNLALVDYWLLIHSG